MNKLYKKIPILVWVSGLLSLPATAQRETTGTTSKTDSVPYNFVLVEDFSATWCNNCPSIADSFQRLGAVIDNMAIIGYQISETRPDVRFLYNMDVYQRSAYYDTIRSIPQILVNGQKISADRIEAPIREAAARKTPYALELSVSHFPERQQNKDSFDIQVKIKKTATDTVRNLRLHVAFTQDHLPFRWYNQSEVNHAVTFMIPDGNGTKVELDANGEAVYRFSVAKDYARSRFLVKNGSVIAFIQDETVVAYDTLYHGNLLPIRKNTVLQTAKTYLGDGHCTELGVEERTLPDFHNWDTEISDGQSTRYFDNTFGHVQTFSWTFEGGKPAVSDEANPMVYYEQPGTYPVSLTVVMDGEMKSIRKENVIRVLDFKPKFTIEPAAAKPNQNLRLSLLSEADSCEWRFFGGDPFLSYGKTAQVKFPLEGTYDVQLKTFYKSPFSGKQYTADSTASKVIVIRKDAENETDDSHTSEIRIRETFPGSARFTVETRSGNTVIEYVEVFSVTGTRILRTPRNVFDLSPYANGIYIVSVKTSGKIPSSFKIRK